MWNSETSRVIKSKNLKFMFQIIQYFKLRNPEYKFIFQITKFKNNFRNFVNKKIVDNFFYINNNNIFFILF